MISIKNLGFQYATSDSLALEVGDLQISEGEKVLLAGRTGCGKSTLLRSINGLIPHFFGGSMVGHVFVDGHDTRKERPAKLSECVGTLLQDPEDQILMLTVRNEIRSGMKDDGTREAEFDERIGRIAERLGILHLIKRSTHELSSGEKQRVAIAAVLARGPKHILMDEPTSQLDFVARRKLFDIFESPEFSETSLILSEHRVERLNGRCSRCLLMQNGRIVEDTDFRGLEKWYRTNGIEIENTRRGNFNDEGNGKGERLLEVSGLSVSFQGRGVLHDASLTLHKGEIVSLLGLNGSGKTTLFRAIMNFARRERGNVKFKGMHIDHAEPPAIAQHIGYLSQNPLSYLFQPTLREELEYSLLHIGARGPGMEEDIRNISVSLGIEDLMHRFPRDLSCGQREIAAIASVLVGGRECLLLDEPTRGMDYWRKEEFMYLLEMMKKRLGTGIIVATHDLQIASEWSDRVYILRNGELDEIEVSSLGEDSFLGS